MSVEIRPPFAHTSTLISGQPARIGMKAVRQSVGEFMKHDLLVQTAVSVWFRAGEDKHLHAPRLTVWGGREVGVVCPGEILRLS